MAIISSYPIIGAMQDNDSWIGTDFATKQTKQYTADSLADYLNTNNKIFIGVESINGGSGVTVTGTVGTPIVSLDYSNSGDNLIQAATESTSTIGVGPVSPYILMNESYPGITDATVKKIRLDNISLDRFGAAARDVNMNGQVISNLAVPVSTNDAANKAYVDASVVGGLFYQGGYDASTNTPDIMTLPNDIRKGWTYTVTADGNVFGEQLRVGDVLIAEIDSPYSYTFWTVVQNNVDLADDTKVGIGNVLAGDAINVSYSAGSATTSVDYSAGSNNLIQSATATSIVGGSYNTSPYVLISESNSSDPHGEVSKIRIGSIPLNKIGAPIGDLYVNSKQIKQLQDPTDSNDAVNKTYVDTALTGYVQSVTSGEGLSTTGSSATPTVAVDYSEGASNIIQSATATTTFGGNFTTTPYILISDSNSSVSNGEAKKIRIGDVPLDLIGTPTGSVFMQNQRIVNLATPISTNDAVTKAYVDSAVVGGLFYQGGYDASTNTPDIISLPNNILKGWTYTVTADGNSFGEQLRVGDVLIAETNSPSSLNSWTIVQNNVDLSSPTQVGIGNVVAGTDMSVTYSNGTATLNNTFTSPASVATGTIGYNQTSGTVSHNFGYDVVVQTYLSTGQEVFCEINRTNTSVTATIGSGLSSVINILVHKIT